jgi:hypothetical protein
MPLIGVIPTLSDREQLRVEKVNPRFVACSTRAARVHSFPPVKVMGRRRKLVSAVPPGP